MFDPQQRKHNRNSRIGMALFRMAQAIKKISQAESDAVGLSPAQIQALLFARYTRGDIATVGHFANSIGATHVTAVKIVNGLAGKKLIAKRQAESDRRVTLLSLTPKGQEVAAKLEAWGQTLERCLDNVSEDVLSRLETGLGAVVAALQKAGHLVVAEPCMGCIHFRPNTGNADAPHYCNLIHKYLAHEETLKQCPEHTPANLESQ